MLLRFTDVFHRRTFGSASGLAFNATLESSAARTAALDRVVDVLAAEGRLTAWRGEYLQHKIMPMISIAARELVGKHLRSGDLTVLTTAASRFLTGPIAREFGFENLIATEPQMHEDRFTGRVAGTPNMREGKIARLEAWLAERGDQLARFRQSWFYSDSRNDIPLLSLVTHPVAVNADPTLAALASEKGWPMLRIR